MTLKTPAFNDAKTYGFEYLRLLLESALQEGVVGAGDFKVTAAAAGLLRVDVAAGTALVKGDSGVPGAGLSQGLYLLVNDAAIANALTFTAAHASLPRLDQVVLRVRDTSDLGSASDTATLELVTGTATAGATLDNRNGAGALPADAIRLADVLIPAAATVTAAGNVRDRRPWARGAYRRIVDTAGNYTSASTTAAVISATRLSPRIECSGVTLRARLTGRLTISTTNTLIVTLRADGAALGDPAATEHFGSSENAVGAFMPLNADVEGAPAAGSRVIAPYAHVTGGTLTLLATAATPLRLVVEELVRQDAENT